MSRSRQVEGWSPAQKALHWTMALIIVFMVPVGLTMAGRDPSPLINTLYELHKSFGLTAFTLAVLRVAVRATRGAPPFVPGMPAWQRTAAQASHYALYLLIFLVPLTGWTATSACCAPVRLFWTIPVTLPVGGGMDAAKIIFRFHYGLAFTLIGIVLIHVSAALYHHFVRRDRTLVRMWPGGAASAERPGDEVRVADHARGA